MSAEILRRAASQMRQNASAVTSLGVWREGEELPPEDTPFVRYVASMNPEVALAVADLLTVWADRDLLNSSGSLPDEKAGILAVATAYLGSDA